MLEVVKRKQDLVEKTYRRDGSLFLETQKGLLRLKPRNDSIVRISYTQKGEFTGNIGIGILEEKEWDGWTCEEQESRVVLYTEKLALEVDKRTGSIRYLERNGRLFLAEREEDSRELEEFDSYKTVIDENTKIEEVETADGVKRVIKEASMVFDKKLYHTRLHLKWQESERLYGLGQAEEGLLNLRGKRAVSPSGESEDSYSLSGVLQWLWNPSFHRQYRHISGYAVWFLSLYGSG